VATEATLVADLALQPVVTLNASNAPKK